MLGRKQSLKGEPVLADYGEELNNENTEIEWINKVNLLEKIVLQLMKYLIPSIKALGEAFNATLCTDITPFSVFEHTKNIRKISTIVACNTDMRYYCDTFIHF